MFPFSKKKPLLAPDDEKKVVAAIQSVEVNTTGEIRVFVESKCDFVDALDQAKAIFEKMGMTNTVHRNAILIYLALHDHQFAIFGDKAIYEKAGDPVFWETAALELKNYLKQGKIADGLVVCIHELGKALAQHFPHDDSINKNELPDEIVFGK